MSWQQVFGNHLRCPHVGAVDCGPVATSSENAMWSKILQFRLSRLIKKGSLVIVHPDQSAVRFGAGEPEITVRVVDPAVLRQLVLNPELALGEGYTDGQLTVDDDDIYGLLALLMENQPDYRMIGSPRLDRILHSTQQRLQQYNPARRSRNNVAHHYDLSNDFFRLFLDRDLQYSCAYFPRPDATLEEAQAAKKAHIAGKLLLKPGMRVLDIGCGWGGLALMLARDHGVHVTGITLSTNQHRLATERAEQAGLSDRIDFRLADYRSVEGRFDRVVSVGMFEHVGVPQYDTFFRVVRDRLTEDGVAMIHTIGRAAPPASTGPWIRKYIFPGGYVPALSEAMCAVERQDLWPTDIEVWRLHYAETLRHWRARFEDNLDAVRAMYDDRFCRMWRFYLIASELSFRLGRQVVFQLQLARQQDAVPLTRDYLYPSQEVAVSTKKIRQVV